MGGVTELGQFTNKKTNMQSVNGAVVTVPRNSAVEEVRHIKI